MSDATPDETEARPAPGDALTASIERFDLDKGGPYVGLQQRLHLLGNVARTAPRRAAALVAIAFVVPLLLSLAGGTAFGPVAERPFLTDWGTWARFVIAIAVFVLMERLVAERLKVHLRQFAATPLLAPRAMSAAAGAVDRALARRDSPIAEIACVVLAYAISVGGAAVYLNAENNSWIVQGLPEGAYLTAAAWWAVLISAPIFWFLLLRWLWRHLVWALLLRELARLDLRLVVTHPDGLGGVAFIGQYPNAFAAFVFALSCVLAAAVAKALQHDALALTAYGYVMGVWLVIMLALFGVPLLAFSRPLGLLKRRALLQASAASTRHFRAAERAALGGNIAASEDAADQAVGDIPNPTATYTAAKKLRTLPFSREALVPVAGAAIVPLVLAGSTTLPFADLMKIARKLLLL